MNPRLVILSGGRAGTVEPLTAAVSSVGRHATCRVRLDADQDAEVSNRHPVIQKRDAVWTVRDLGSIHGTYLNGTRISEEQPLNDGDRLRLGASGPELQFLLSDRAPVAEPTREPAPFPTAGGAEHLITRSVFPGTCPGSERKAEYPTNQKPKPRGLRGTVPSSHRLS